MKALTPTQKQKVRAALTKFCLEAEKYRLNWHYVQQRPFHGYGLPASRYHIADCSAFVSLAWNWAMHETGIYLADPLNEKYSGIGNTDTLFAWLRGYPVSSNHVFLPGDFAEFGFPGHTVHVSMCRTKGTTNTAIFTSNGHESTIFNADAPEPITLAHEKAQQHLVGVYRHPQLA